MRKELNGVKTALTQLSAEIRDLHAMARQMLLALDELKCDVSEIKVDMATKSDISALCARMDGFSDLLREERP